MPTHTKATFLAVIAPGLTAIRFTGDCNGQRITLDIPETQIGNAAGLLGMRRHLLRITVEDLGTDLAAATSTPLEDDPPVEVAEIGRKLHI